MAKGVYIHIPFCHQICNYCDFNKVFFKNQPVDEYIECLGKEMKMTVAKNPQAFERIETIFFGGGTPTALSPEQLERLLILVKEAIPMDAVKEFSSEANPDELTREKIKVLHRHGVNRLSIGVQSFDQELLRKLGRTHDNDHVYKTIQAAKEEGFTNISIDLMYGLPGQTMEQWQHTLKMALELQLPHFSAYSLIVEPKTIFYNLMNKGKLPLPGEDNEADMYNYLMDTMEKSGLEQYEISNFGKAGHESLHNLIYWDNEEYAGFGAGASGYLDGVRYSNHGPLKKYMEAIDQGELPILNRTQVDWKAQVEEELFLGLRKSAGINKTHFSNKFGKPVEAVFGDKIIKLVQDGLLVEENDQLKLSKNGRFVGNEVFQEFLLD
ncbi:radical SAM family heme chaperone HemW [Kurthia sibirica]|uniref:Heme chaperone HemW n=1 Tax=Kurthia sibirica TaxID=202750 RepID=A0A2U3AJX5_9BACL|nr:radical SAM family heme chaperone HemW [Kurthia sibirica]PWI24848.1 oxygen-independent coproporphyrinogen III oxidase [Kurthia sibirica]GEK33303.1 coproporphyrinogen III oxidase [Kurthia sibirica]